MKLFALWFNTIETDLQDMFILKQFPNRDSIGIAMLFHNFPLYLFKIKLVTLTQHQIEWYIRLKEK